MGRREVVLVEKLELQAKVEASLSECWSAYSEELLALQPAQIIDRAAEIAAARLCYENLTANTMLYPDHLLEHLLCFDDPLAVLREQWQDEQEGDHSIGLEHALWSLWDHGPALEDTVFG